MSSPKRNNSPAALVECPFYRRDSAKLHNIVCESPVDNHSVAVGNITMNFGNDEQWRQEWLTDYCRNFPNYTECWIYKQNMEKYR